MAQAPIVTSSERLDLGIKPSERKSAEDFINSFDISSVPTEPGCYIMYDEHDKPVYVGKANNLRARLRTYITERDSRYTVKFLMRRVDHVQFLVTMNEKEALLLENSLIKQYKPPYNIRLKDDKTYVSLRVDMRETYPRFTIVRRYQKDGARYFGPYSSAHSVRETIRQLYRIFPLRRCTDTVMNRHRNGARTRPCLYHQMGQCPGFCVGVVDPEVYRETVEQAVMVLEGRSDELDNHLRARIAACAEKLEFENAATLRDRLFALEKTVERQRTVAVPGAEDRDVFGFYREGRFTQVQALFFRGGKLLDARGYSFEKSEMPIEELFSSFLLQFYAQAATIPSEVLIPINLDEAGTLSEILSEQRGSKANVHWPQRGEKQALIEMAMRNAASHFKEKRLAEKAQRDVLEQVQKTFELSVLPERIECFDISTIQGEKPAGSMVTFEGGVANKARYRHFAIKTVEGQDDFGMLREVLTRRFQRAIDENDLPDLAVIDGGKGQLNVAVAVFEDLGIEDLPAIGMAKARAEEWPGFSKTGSESPAHPQDRHESEDPVLEKPGHLGTPERFFLPGRKNPIVPHQNSAVVHLMQRIRDEAHRFAITYHRKRRAKGTLRTSLTEIPGVGEKRARILLNKFGSLAKIRHTSVQEIAAVPGFNEKLAGAIVEHLKKN